MSNLTIHSIIDHAVSLREQGHAMNPNHVRGILTQIEWLVGVDEPQRAVGGLDAIIELVTRLRDEGREIDTRHVSGILSQIEWVVNNNTRIGDRPRRTADLRSAGQFHRPVTPEPPLQTEIREIDAKKFESLCEDACAICLETHKCGDSMETECGHSFGQQCWSQWINRSHAKSCPTCRKSRPASIHFSAKK